MQDLNNNQQQFSNPNTGNKKKIIIASIAAIAVLITIGTGFVIMSKRPSINQTSLSSSSINSTTTSSSAVSSLASSQAISNQIISSQAESLQSSKTDLLSSTTPTNSKSQAPADNGDDWTLVTPQSVTNPEKAEG